MSKTASQIAAEKAAADAAAARVAQVEAFEAAQEAKRTKTAIQESFEKSQPPKEDTSGWVPRDPTRMPEPATLEARGITAKEWLAGAPQNLGDVPMAVKVVAPTDYKSIMATINANISQYNSIAKEGNWDDYDWSKYPGGKSQYITDMNNLKKQRQKIIFEHETEKNDIPLYEKITTKPRELTHAEREALYTAGTKFVVTYAENGEEKKKVFDTLGAAEAFSDLWKKENIRYVVRYSVEGVETKKEFKTEEEAQKFADTIKLEAPTKAGAGVRTGLGPSIGWSKRLYDWGEQIGDPKWKDKPFTERDLSDFIQSQTEFYSAVLGTAVLNPVENAVAWLNAITGKPGEKIKQVDVETLKEYEDIDPARQVYLRVGGAGASYLATYAAMIPVGVAATGVFTAAKGIASATGVSTPAGIAKIAQAIASHPKLAQAILWAPIVGMEASTVYTDYKSSGNLVDALSKEAVRAGVILGTAKGLEAGFRLPDKIKGYLATRGRTEIPLTKLMSLETIERTQDLPFYKSASKQDFSEEFKAYARQFSASEYMGEVAPGELRVWHGTEEYSLWVRRLGLTTEVQAGTSLDKFPGLFVAPEVSPLRLPTSMGYEAKLGLPIYNTKGYGAYGIDAIVDVMPSGLSRSQAASWLAAQVGKGTAYIPPVSMITREMEAIIPEGTMLKLVGTDWYINWAGVRVPVNKYVLIGAEEAAGVGTKLVSFADIASSTLPSKDVYLSFGLVTPVVTGSNYTSLSPTQISKLAESYGVSVSEMKSIISTLTNSISSVSTPITSTKYTKLSEYLTSSALSSLSELDYSRFASELTKLSPSELSTTLSSMQTSVLASTLSSMTSTEISSISPTIISTFTSTQITTITNLMTPKTRALFFLALKSKFPEKEKPVESGLYFTVTFTDYGGRVEVLNVRASSFHEAYNKARSIQKWHGQKHVVDIIRKGKS